MSEYQYVEFRAVDRPLDDEQLEFAEQQSSHAEVSRWGLAAEYNYSSFRGDVDGLLRGGFDIYLAYSNYGERYIKLRLPCGLPFDDQTLNRYLDDERLAWIQDQQGTAGVISLAPFHESLDWDGDFDRYLDSATRIRELLMQGDLRALYLLWLCAADDENYDPQEMVEPPVPHGLADLPSECAELLPFFGLSQLLVQAAADGLPEGPKLLSHESLADTFLKTLSAEQSRELLYRLITEEANGVKAALMAEIRDSLSIADWPCIDIKRSMQELHDSCDVLIEHHNAELAKQTAAKTLRDAKEAEKVRQARMQEMMKASKTWLAKADKLVADRGTDNYKAAADILADLGEAIGDSDGRKLVRAHAAHLAKKHSTLNILKSSLRKRGLLD